MYPISALYKDYLRDINANYLVKVLVDDVEYDNTNIVDFNIENSISLSDGLEIGTAIPSKLTITLRLKSVIPPNAKMVPYLAMSKGETLTEWLPLGEFYIDDRIQNHNVWTFTCLDKLVWADVPYISALSYPATQQAVWDEICDSLDYDYDSSVVINPSYQFQAGPAGFSKRQVLGYIASANGANIYVGKDGVLRFKQFKASDEPVFSFEPSDYMRVKQTNPVKSYTRIVVTYDTADGLTYEAGEGDENHTLHIENPFMTQQMTDDLLTQLDGFSYLPITMDSKGFPHLDQGDIISFGQDESTAWAETETNWEDTQMTWDGIVYHQSVILHHVMSFKGGLKSKIEAPSVSEQRSEFVLPDTLTQQIKLVAKSIAGDSVQLGKAYYGVNVSREEGWIVEREDGKSRAVFNSDELTFYKGSTKSLYFDVANDRYVFDDGLIEAGIVQGSIIRTGPVGEYPRVEINPLTSLIEAASSTNNKVSIESFNASVASPAIFFENQSVPTLYYQTSNQNVLTTPGRVLVSANLGVDLISTDSFVSVTNWSKFRSNDANQTLQQALNSKMDAGAGFTGVVPSWDGANARLLYFTNGLLTDVQLA